MGHSIVERLGGGVLAEAQDLAAVDPGQAAGPAILISPRNSCFHKPGNPVGDTTGAHECPVVARPLEREPPVPL